MDWLNYHHLLHFWNVVRAGGVTPAARRMHLTPSTVSSQVRALEEALGEKLLEKRGRRLVPTEAGRIVQRYAQDIFGLGRELVDAVQGRSTGQPVRFAVGVAEVLPKLLVRRLLQPALDLEMPLHFVCRADAPEALLPQLAAHELDVILADGPVPSRSTVRAVSHLLGDYRVAWFGTATLANRFHSRFPRCLESAPLLLPTANTNLRRSLDAWFDALGIRPHITAEFEDSALMKAFGRDGLGLFPAPRLLQGDMLRRYAARLVGDAGEVHEQCYAWSMQRRMDHPAVAAILEAGRQALTGNGRV